MDRGLGNLGFWLAVGIVVAAMIVSGALKARAKERETQATLRALLEKGGDNAAEVLAYLREKDAAAAPRVPTGMSGKRMTVRQETAFVGAFITAMFAFMGGILALATQSRPSFPKLVFSPEAHRLIPQYPPVPTGLQAFLPVGVMLGIWAAGLVISVLFLAWGGLGKQKNDAQPDA